MNEFSVKVLSQLMALILFALLVFVFAYVMQKQKALSAPAVPCSCKDKTY